MTAWLWCAVALLGGAAAVARVLVGAAVARRWSRALPLGTLVVNISGAFLLGLLSGLALTGDALLLLGTATVGTYTTFSTWMLETEHLGRSGAPVVAAANLVLSLAGGVAAAELGRLIGG